MNIIETIITRKSTRSFTEQKIPIQILDNILKIVHYTPCGMNAQSWFFLAIQDKEEINKINSIIYNCMIKSKNKNFNNYIKSEKNCFYNSNNLIFVFNEYNSLSSEPKIDAALAMYSILLTSHFFNISSCWINIVNTLYRNFPSFKNYFKSHININKMFLAGCVALGYNAEDICKNKKISYNFKIL